MVGLVAFSLVFVALGLTMVRRSPLGALAWSALSLLPMMYGIAQLRMSRAMRRLSSNDRLRTPPAPRGRPTGWLPPPTLEIREEHPAAQSPFEGQQPVPILFLWVFDVTTTGSLLHRLNQLGPVYFLRGGGVLAFDVAQLPRMAFGRIDKMIEESEDEVLARLRSFRVRRRLGYYSLLSMACTDSVWTFALDRMLAEVRVVVVDLSDFEAGRAGISYEIGLLFDRVPLDNVVFVAGPSTDRAALAGVMHTAWDCLAMNSPNRTTGGSVVTVTVAVTTALVEANGANPDDFTAATRAEREFIAGLVVRAAADRVLAAPA